MDLEELRALPANDRWVFVLGRVTTEAVDMDSALRGLHAALRGHHDLPALLAAPEMWTKNIKECRELLAEQSIDAGIRDAISAALDAAAAAWKGRNAFLHELLVTRIDDDAPPPIVAEPRADDDRYRIRMSSKSTKPQVESVTLDEAIALVCDLVAARWRLVAARLFLAGTRSWRDLLLGHVEGDWDGNAMWVGFDDDDDTGAAASGNERDRLPAPSGDGSM